MKVFETHTPAQILRHALIASGRISPAIPNIDWPSTLMYMPDKDALGHRCVTLYDSDSQMLGQIMRTGEQPENYGVQIRLRSQVPNEVFLKGSEIIAWVDELQNYSVTVESGEVFNIIGTGRGDGLRFMGIEDETRLFHASINYKISIE